MHWLGFAAIRRRFGRSSAVLPARHAIEPLEPRVLLNATVTASIAPVGVVPGSAPSTIDLSTHFSDPTVPGTAVDVTTPEGIISLALTDSKTPNTVANFLAYINNGEYQDTIFHRLVAGFVVQGGGYTTSGTHITQLAPINSEAGISNTTGTIAMALSTGPNSATSEWFINLANNSSALDGTSDGGPFTVFGNVVYGGMAVVNKIAALAVVNASSTNAAWNTLPVLNSSNPVNASNEVTNTYSIVPALTYTATSDNTSIVTPTISGSTMTLTFGAATGNTMVHVTATDIAGNTATTSFVIGTGLTTVTAGTGGVQLVRFFDADGTFGRLAIDGPGTATVSLLGSGLQQSATVDGVVTVNGRADSVSISTSGTNTSSFLTIYGGGGGNGLVDLTNLTTDGALGEINAAFAKLSGNLSAGGSIGTLILNSASNGTITLGSGNASNITIYGAHNESLSASATIQSLNSISWTGTGTITGSTINRINIQRSFSAGISATTVGRFNAGSITGGTWSVTGNVGAIRAGSISGWTANLATLGKLTVQGVIDSSTIRASGNIAAVSAASLTNSSILSGVASTVTLPAAASDFVAADTIRSVQIRGRFVNSNVAAQTLNQVDLSSVQTSNGGKTFGVASHDVGSLSLRVDAKRLHIRRVTTAAQVTSALTARGITPQDLAIRIL